MRKFISSYVHVFTERLISLPEGNHVVDITSVELMNPPNRALSLSESSHETREWETDNLLSKKQ